MNVQQMQQVLSTLKRASLDLTEAGAEQTHAFTSLDQAIDDLEVDIIRFGGWALDG